MKKINAAIVVLGVSMGAIFVPCKAEGLKEITHNANSNQASGSLPINRSKSPSKGFYLTAAAGFIAPDTSSSDLVIDSQSLSGTTSQNTSFSGEFGVGYDFGAFRSELTYGYSPISSNLTTFSQTVGNQTYSFSQPLGSSVNLSSLLISAYYDIHTKTPFTPYLGGGIGPGFAVSQQRVLSADGCTPGCSSYSVYSRAQSTTVLTYQLKLGVSFAASSKADIFAEAGYLGFGGYSSSFIESDGNYAFQIDYGPNGGFVSKLGFRYRL